MDLWDVLALLGIVGLGAGLWMLAPWLGVSVASSVLIAVALSGSILSEKAAARQALIDAKKGGA